MRRRCARRPSRPLGLVAASLVGLTALVATGCSAFGPQPEPLPTPTPTSTESVAQAFARAQLTSDTPDHLPTGSLDPGTLRRLAVIPPVTWYVARNLDRSGYCALGVWALTAGSVSGSLCVSEAEFASTGIQTFFGTDHREAHVWIAPDAGTVRQPGWTVVGPSVLVPVTGPISSQSPSPSPSR